jgi:hypothetical protein
METNIFSIEAVLPTQTFPHFERDNLFLSMQEKDRKGHEQKTWRWCKDETVLVHIMQPAEALTEVAR